MLKEFENLFKETGGSLTPECNKEHASFLRRLLCRFIDVSEAFPDFYSNISKSLYFLYNLCDPDVEGFHKWNIKIEYVETTGEKMCKVTCPTYVSYGDYDCHNTIIKVHSEILLDDWKTFLEELFRRKMVDGIKKQITAIENVISTGPSQIETLKKELEKLEKEKCTNFGNVSTV